jgi:hypothetical protein
MAQLDRTGGHVVDPEIAGAAAGKVEAGLMLIAGQDPVLVVPRSSGRPMWEGIKNPMDERRSLADLRENYRA